MKLDLKQLRSVTYGALYVNEEKITSYENGRSRAKKKTYYTFSRFTEEQIETYSLTGFFGKSLSTAGVRLRFYTDSKTLKLAAKIAPSSSRKFFAFDVEKNGELLGSLKNYLDDGSFVDAQGNPTTDFPSGNFSGEFDLGEGEKLIEVYFPWSVIAKLEAVELDDGATLTPAPRAKKMLLFGDSITHGYDAMNPSRSYASLISNALDAEGINKGIGGEIHCPKIAKWKDPVKPDYITVAYGTNDWSGQKKEVFEERCKEFYKNLTRNYPKAQIFALLPVWRKDHERVTKVGVFEDMRKFITKTAGRYKNVTVIDCYPFIPQDENLYSDKYLHPTDEGFSYYYEGLYAEISKILKEKESFS